MKNVKVCEK